MKHLSVVLVLSTALTVTAAEPQPRAPKALALRVAAMLPHVSSALELPDGRLVISDFKTPRVSLLDPSSGALTILGSEGVGAGQYVQPGGFYGLKERWLLDRGQAKAIAVSPAGVLGAARPISKRGTTTSSDADRDLYQLDERGFTYFLDRPFGFGGPIGTSVPMVDLIRFDPIKQQGHVVGRIQQRETHSTAGGDGMIFSRAVVGSPADGWGVAADGRVAIVRAAPYRVDWYSPTGAEVRGPVHQVDVLPMTEADKAAVVAASAGRTASVGTSAAPGASTSGPGPLFAATKAPFEPDDVLVSPAGRVYVQRTRPAGAIDVVYDVFDGKGIRTDRILLPMGSRIVGFSSGAVYVRQPAANGTVTLKKFEVR